MSEPQSERARLDRVTRGVYAGAVGAIFAAWMPAWPSILWTVGVIVSVNIAALLFCAATTSSGPDVGGAS